MPFVSLAVNGTLMRGLELNSNLLAVGAIFLREDQTEPAYRLFSIGDRHRVVLEHSTVGLDGDYPGSFDDQLR